MHRWPLLSTAPLVVATSFLCGRASAEPVPTTAADSPGGDGRDGGAMGAFQSGRELMAQKRYEEACRQFEESERLDPGVGTMLNLGYCYEKLGKTASAWGTYREAAAAAQENGRSDWQSAALERVARLESSLLRVVIEVQAQSAGDTLNVLVDGTPLPRSVWGQPAPLYPGQHEVRANAANRRSWTLTFEVNAEHVPTVIVPELAPAVSVSLASATSSQSLSPTASTPAPVLSTRRTAALVLGGAGVAALGSMAVLGATAISTYHGAECVSGVCTPSGVDALSRAHTEGNVATALAAVGGAALVGATVLWFTSPSTRKVVEVQAGIQGGAVGAFLGGAW
jgi:hypothetical protein